MRVSCRTLLSSVCSARIFTASATPTKAPKFPTGAVGGVFSGRGTGKRAGRGSKNNPSNPKTMRLPKEAGHSRNFTFTGIFGGADGIRTHDLLDAIEARSQLRHGPTGNNLTMLASAAWFVQIAAPRIQRQCYQQNSNQGSPVFWTQFATQGTHADA